MDAGEIWTRNEKKGKKSVGEKRYSPPSRWCENDHVLPNATVSCNALSQPPYVQ
jgi:hypothetical protein